ncbi:nuclear transport factor 2 family protein [Actinomadura rayongensis]|uniref:SnoaL-like domain-containing protein n=1 Tax=Actinomadura rayongensis TaxID=1429076 RepID=A0A6I4W9N7_9ACTN|nr:nuclear transport factor 2 family protein [Actinomadura rayongensis]MXQ67549.1 hypothetical protein [Actinomadura rayongensis]
MTQPLIEKVQQTYEAWNAGALEDVVAAFDGGLTWVVPGRTDAAGKAETKEQVTTVLRALADSGYQSSPRHYLADEDRVVVLLQATIDGKQHGAVDVWTFEGGKLAKYQHASTDTTLIDRALSGE